MSAAAAAAWGTGASPKIAPRVSVVECHNPSCVRVLVRDAPTVRHVHATAQNQLVGGAVSAVARHAAAAGRAPTAAPAALPAQPSPPTTHALAPPLVAAAAAAARGAATAAPAPSKGKRV